MLDLLRPTLRPPWSAPAARPAPADAPGKGAPGARASSTGSPLRNAREQVRGTPARGQVQCDRPLDAGAIVGMERRSPDRIQARKIGMEPRRAQRLMPLPDLGHHLRRHHRQIVHLLPDAAEVEAGARDQHGVPDPDQPLPDLPSEVRRIGWNSQGQDPVAHMRKPPLLRGAGLARADGEPLEGLEGIPVHHRAAHQARHRHRQGTLAGGRRAEDRDLHDLHLSAAVVDPGFLGRPCALRLRSRPAPP